MTKVVILGPASQQDELLTTLRNLGIVHLTHTKEPAGADLEKIRTRVQDVQQGLGMLPKGRHDDPSGMSGPEILEELEQIGIRKHRLGERLDAVRREKRQLEPLGDVDPGGLHQLTQQGIEVHIYHVKKGVTPVPPGGVLVVPLNEDRSGS